VPIHILLILNEFISALWKKSEYVRKFDRFMIEKRDETGKSLHLFIFTQSRKKQPLEITSALPSQASRHFKKELKTEQVLKI
jgi:hypothetical protein